jgi:hypothetical protein
MHQILLQFFHKIAVESLFPYQGKQPAGKNCRKIVERFCGPSSGSTAGKNCGKIVERFCARTILPHFIPAALPVQGPQNLSTIVPQLFYNSSSLGRIWCIRIGFEKNCRRKNRRRIVETFGECRPSLVSHTHRHIIRQPLLVS